SSDFHPFSLSFFLLCCNYFTVTSCFPRIFFPKEMLRDNR
ncbi:hypothetical protein NT03LS_2446a, partial [Listeria seeligeri FSL N1-067]